MNWFKLYAEFASDAKVQSMPEAMQRRLVMLFCLQAGGDLETLEDEEIALAMRISLKDLQKTREVFQRKGFIGDDWTPRNWEKRQSSTDTTAAERMRRYRNRLRDGDRNVTSPVTAVTCNVPVNPPGARAEEIRREGEESRGGENVTPAPPLDSLGQECLRVATERWGASNGDSVIGDLLRNHPSRVVRYAIDREWDKHNSKLNVAYLRSICQGTTEASLKKPGELNGRTAVQQPDSETKSKIQRPKHFTNDANGEKLRAIWDGFDRGDPP